VNPLASAESQATTGERLLFRDGSLMQPPAVGGRPPRSHARAGFTLIEVLASLLILAIVVPVAMQAVSLATGTATISRQRAEAAALAESQLAYLMASGEWQTGTLQGDFGELYPEFQWFASVNTWTQPNVMQLDVMVSWYNNRRGEESIVVSTLVYQLGFDDGTGEGTDDGTGTTGTSGTSGTGGTP